MSLKLTTVDYADAAISLGVETAAVVAVTKVESRGDGFLKDGHPIILFERHIMWRLVRDKFGKAKADQLARQFGDVINPTPGGYGATSSQPGRMDKAAALIDRDCALQSASWGLFQIMGFHWKALGYVRLQDFINAMYRSEAGQLDAFVRFVKINPAIHKALKAHDWASFAKGFNGPSYKINDYDNRLASAFKQASASTADRS